MLVQYTLVSLKQYFTWPAYHLMQLKAHKKKLTDEVETNN